MFNNALQKAVVAAVILSQAEAVLAAPTPTFGWDWLFGNKGHGWPWGNKKPGHDDDKKVCTKITPECYSLYLGNRATLSGVCVKQDEDTGNVFVTVDKIQGETLRDLSVYIGGSRPGLLPFLWPYQKSKRSCVINADGSAKCTIGGDIFSEKNIDKHRGHFYLAVYAETKSKKTVWGNGDCIRKWDKKSGKFKKFKVKKTKCPKPEVPEPPCTTTTTTTTPTTPTPTPSEPPVSTPTPLDPNNIHICKIGAAFGKVDDEVSPPLNGLDHAVPGRWGWYNKLPVSSLKAGGVTIPLYTGADNNDMSTSRNVGSTKVTVSGNTVSLAYSLKQDLDIAWARTYVSCSPPDFFTADRPSLYGFEGEYPNQVYPGETEHTEVVDFTEEEKDDECLSDPNGILYTINYVETWEYLPRDQPCGPVLH